MLLGTAWEGSEIRCVEKGGAWLDDAAQAELVCAAPVGVACSFGLDPGHNHSSAREWLVAFE